ncbi:MAG: HAMP domain-containing protein [Chloroflexi bacterium]|nr:HAMP domain-containing protein [Chloroflexota bacterium]
MTQHPTTPSAKGLATAVPASARPETSWFQRLADRFWDVAGAVSLQSKIMGIVLSLVIFFGLGVTLQVRTVLYGVMSHELREHGVAISRDLANRSTDLVLTGDLYMLHEVLRNTLESNDDVRYAFVVNAQGEVLGHTFGDQFPVDLLTANGVGRGDPVQVQLLETEEGEVVDFAMPIFGGRAGTARVGMSEHHLRQTLADVTFSLLLTTLVVSLAGLGLAFVLIRVLTRPVKQLVEATEAIARGDLGGRIPVWANDEIGQLQRAFNDMTIELGRARAERREREALRLELLQRVIRAQEEERKRVARELHDETAQSLTSLMVNLKVLQKATSLSQAQHQAGELRRLAGDTLMAIHNLAVQLRPSVLDDLGLKAAIEQHAREYKSRYGIAVDTHIHGFDDRRLPPEVETTLYRIIQEAMTNTVKYAQASTVSVLLEIRNGRVRAIIEDDGVGFDVDALLRGAPKEHKLGIFGMRERAELLGGKLSIESAPGQGTTVIADVPVIVSPIALPDRVTQAKS